MCTQRVRMASPAIGEDIVKPILPPAPSLIMKVLPWINLAIAITAFVISYSVSLSSPDIRVSVSAPQWVMRPLQFGDALTKNNAAIKLTGCEKRGPQGRGGRKFGLGLKLSFTRLPSPPA
jgi:hypothetical protein